MAYAIRYQARWYSLDSSGWLYIQEKDYTDPDITTLTLLPDGIEITNSFDGWNKPIFKQNATLEILNDKSDFFELMPLLENEEKQFKVLIYKGNGTTKLFEGFIDTKTANEKYLKKRPIRLTASNYISKLKGLYPLSIEGTERNSLINILGECLALTGKADPIWVSCSLECSTGFGYATGHTLFNKCGVDAEAFWTSTTGRMDAQAIIEEILKPFDCYIYWVNGKWIIERYGDIWNDTAVKPYVVYDFGSSYDHETGGSTTVQTDLSTNLHDLVFKEQTQTISFIPGIKGITVSANQQEYESLIRNDFSQIEKTNWQATNNNYYDVSTRMWKYYSTDGYPGPLDHFTGIWGVDVSGYFQTEFEFQMPDGSLYGSKSGPIYNSITRRGMPTDNGDPTNVDPIHISTAFNLTVDYDTYLTVKWKIRGDSGWPSKHASGFHWKNATTYVPFDVYNEPTYRCRYTLSPAKIKGENRSFIKYDDETKTTARFWEYEPYGMGVLKLRDASIYNYIDIPFDGFDDQGYAEVEQTIHLGSYDCSLHGIYQNADWKFILSIDSTQLYDLNTPTDTCIGTRYYETFGDVEVVASVKKTDNTFHGSINTDAITEEKITLNLFDIENLNMRNGIYTGPDSSMFGKYPIRTTEWSTGTGAEGFYTLIERLLWGKFQLYNKTRQMISGDIIDSRVIRPFTIFGDAEQPQKQFILGSNTFRPLTDHHSLDLMEYDNTTDISIFIDRNKFIYTPNKFKLDIRDYLIDIGANTHPWGVFS